LQSFQSIFEDRFDFTCLQKQIGENDRALLDRAGVRCLGDELVDFSDTAALCTLMDLVISIDTSVAHLAGALGVPVWVLLPWHPDWRWMLDRDDSPWYNSMRLFRQTERGNWGPILQDVKLKLQALFD
jgi:ADP-heptose:LPS heptosyltransferase